MQKSWKYYHENPKKDRSSLYAEMARVSSSESSGVTRAQDEGRVSVYNVLNAKVFVRSNGSGMRTHTFMAETEAQIDKAKSRIEELTGVELVGVGEPIGAKV